MNKTIRCFFQNGYFLLLTFATGLFYFCFYLVTLTLGIGLSFTVAGIPLLTQVLRTTLTFVQYERIQTKIYTDITTQPYERSRRTEQPLWVQAKEELMDIRNWVAICWLMLKLWIGIFCLLCAALLCLMPLLLMLTPLFFPIFEIHFFGIQIDTFMKSLFIMVIGVVFAFISSWLLKVLVRFIGGYTRHMTKRLNR
ncbi:sensor domain-containing protein [Paenibacillus pabuli]|uniref:sensor domain-containing protein n=1 Tax=Paenibacillus pabuli TaxID=1472 RepID=UPI0007841BB4|nr:sensor domain-containing protein [Paenibacillus pabuli]MEC0124786.1 sensor domain-containing protein [Paenibacillus pabuli]